MSGLLPFIIVGISTGAIYGLAGVGLVLTYKTSGIFNFAHGAIATLAAFAFYQIYVDGERSATTASIVSVLVLGVVIGLAFEFAARRLTHRSLGMQVTATVGILTAVQAALIIQYGSSPRRFPRFLPEGIVRFGGTNVRADQIIVVVVSAVATSGLYCFLRWANLGRNMRAIVDNEEMVSLSGTNPVRVRRWAWMIGATFGTLSGVLIAANLPLDATAFTLLIVQAFGAAAVGRFRNLPLTWLGGILLGVAASVSTKYTGSISWLRGLPASLPFIILIIVLLLQKPSAQAATKKAMGMMHSARNPSLTSQGIGAVAVVGALCFVPSFAGFRLDAWTIGLAQFILMLSLGLLIRTSGQISLCHMTFAAIGATSFSRFAIEGGLPWLVALVLAGLVAVPVGALVAIPAVRLSGLYLALATFGFGILVQQMFYSTDWMFGVQNTGRKMPRPSFLGIDFETSRNFYFLVLGLSVLVAVVVTALTRTRLGRLLKALSDSPLALATTGQSVVRLRVVVFCISAFFAAIAGAILGMVITSASANSYPPFESLVLVVIVVISVGGTPWYALVPALAITLIPTYLEGETAEWLHLVFGVSALAVGLGLHVGLRRRDSSSKDDVVVTPDAKVRDFISSASESIRFPPVGLEVVDLTVGFGGLVAVNGLSLSAPPGQITGLIGPNGAGKTTTFNACTGLVVPSGGHVLLDGVDVTAESPAHRARRGLGRTFQRIELYDSLTVRENVALGREAALAGRGTLAQIYRSPASRAIVAQATDEAIELCNVGRYADKQVGSLSTGARRLVELARCLAGPFGFLLLDEPSSGLDNAETARFGDLLTTVVAERGCGILLVEHDMSLVMKICAFVHVIDFGQPIFAGEPDAVRSSTLVREAYLGSAAHPSPMIGAGRDG